MKYNLRKEVVVNPFSRAKNYVRDHKTEIMVGAGVALITVIVVMKVKGSNQPGSITRIAVSSENLQKLIDNTEGVIAVEPRPREHIWIINSATREVFP